jgi:hypothetical protein
MKLKKNITNIVHTGDKDDDGFVMGKPAELFELVWDLTCDVWAFGGLRSAERRLQRDVTNLVGRKS